jgi:hypothetical protein
MDRMGYGVMAVGERELALGYDYFRSLTADTGMEVVNSNVVYGPTKSRVGKDYAILDEGGVKVGFFSLYFHQSIVGRRDAIDEGGFVAEDPIAAANRVLPKLHKKCDVVVLIAHGPWGQISDFLSEVSDFDFVIAAHDGGLDRTGREVNGTTVMKAGNRGQTMGEVSFVVSPEGDVELSSMQSISVKTNLPEDPEVAGMVREMNDEYNKMRRTETLQQQRRATAKGKGHSYLGDAICRRCHEDVYQAWLATPHALAYEALEEKGKQSDSDCVQCHTTGNGDPTGFVLLPDEVLKSDAGGPSFGHNGENAAEPGAVSAGTETDFRAVQCEACHGKGTEHVRGGMDFLKVTESECTVCHDFKNSPDFDYGEYLPHVSCKVLMEDSR